jgi:N6-L-threonylcarbamoyladenine synthase
MTFLAIDTSFDETSVAITRKQLVLANTIYSRSKDHADFGGVIPMVAQQLHIERMQGVLVQAFQEANVTWADIDAIAVTYGPGLAPALQVGIEKAWELAQEHDKPLYAINHMAGHVASCYTQVAPSYPLISLLLSGGHSELVLVQSFGEMTILGQTVDDALGEAYDKVARMLGLGYPGGRLLAEQASIGNPDAYDLPVPMLQSGNLNLSYSGLKNAVRLLIEKTELTETSIADIAASFERVAQESVLRKLKKALEMHPEVRQLPFGGGVAANTIFRGKLYSICKEYDVELLIPENMKLCTDNAAMIGLAAWFGVEAGQMPVAEKPDRVPYLSLEGRSFTLES